MENIVICEEIQRGRTFRLYKGRKRGTIQFLSVYQVDSSEKESITNHVRLVNRIKHINIIEFIEWYETNSHFWLVTELCSGSTLEEIILNDGSFPVESIKKYFISIIKGLFHIHSLAILMGSLCPRKIKFSSSGTLKIVDFRNSGLFIENQQNCMSINKDKSWEYIAPEVKQSNVYTIEGDLWSLGAIIYSLITGVIGTSEYSKDESELDQLVLSLLEIDPTKRINWHDLLKNKYFNNEFNEYFTKYDELSEGEKLLLSTSNLLNIDGNCNTTKNLIDFSKSEEFESIPKSNFSGVNVSKSAIFCKSNIECKMRQSNDIVEENELLQTLTINDEYNDILYFDLKAPQTFLVDINSNIDIGINDQVEEDFYEKFEESKNKFDFLISNIKLNVEKNCIKRVNFLCTFIKRYLQSSKKCDVLNEIKSHHNHNFSECLEKLNSFDSSCLLIFAKFLICFYLKFGNTHLWIDDLFRSNEIIRRILKSRIKNKKYRNVFLQLIGEVHIKISQQFERYSTEENCNKYVGMFDSIDILDFTRALREYKENDTFVFIILNMIQNLSTYNNQITKKYCERHVIILLWNTFQKSKNEAKIQTIKTLSCLMKLDSKILQYIIENSGMNTIMKFINFFVNLLKEKSITYSTKAKTYLALCSIFQYNDELILPIVQNGFIKILHEDLAFLYNRKDSEHDSVLENFQRACQYLNKYLLLIMPRYFGESIDLFTIFYDKRHVPIVASKYFKEGLVKLQIFNFFFESSIFFKSISKIFIKSYNVLIEISFILSVNSDNGHLDQKHADEFIKIFFNLTERFLLNFEKKYTKLILQVIITVLINFLLITKNDAIHYNITNILFQFFNNDMFAITYSEIKPTVNSLCKYVLETFIQLKDPSLSHIRTQYLSILCGFCKYDKPLERKMVHIHFIDIVDFLESVNTCSTDITKFIKDFMFKNNINVC
ncbi:hypothetical protein A3Q56_00149 [Intoshia linei]|uniref:Protein kinase domain-containing protein n=1 Tax=Intoshia linei TaxID=1819745 RepID=A0A177BCN3_9BILA|nr:hypothetical protein A3Q56_00149 [Intoshia linei]